MVFYCLRFRSKQRGVVTALERQRVELMIMKMTRRESFTKLFSEPEDNTGEKVKHDLAKLSPLVDSNITNRLRGRLSKAKISDVLNNPILLSAKHPAAVLMLREMHVDNNHERADYVRRLVQHRLWVIGKLTALRNIKSKCVKCRKLAVQPLHLHMADLGRKRVEGNVYPIYLALLK